MTAITGIPLRSMGFAVCVAVAAALGSSPARAASIAISCGAVGIEFQLCRQGAETWASRTGNSVRLVSTPNDANERLALYQQLLAAGSGDIAVLQIDIVWTGTLANHLVDLAPHVPESVLARHFAPIVDADTVAGRLVAMPWFADVGLLYYRKDLLARHGLPAPETWQELTRTAQAIQADGRAAGNDRLWGFVWQGRAYEGLTCNALEWIHSFNGGTIVDADGRITIDNPRAAAALDLAASWVGRITPVGVLNYAEEEARAVFQAGDAVFMRNWPYAWSLTNGADSPVRGRVGVAALPKGGPDGRHSGVLGGSQLAVSKYAAARAEAIDLVRYLTGEAEQRRRAIEGSVAPTIAALYRDPAVLAANPFFAKLSGLFAGAVARPSDVTGIRYNQVSNEFWNAVHVTLAGRASAQESLARLKERLEWVSRGGRW